MKFVFASDSFKGTLSSTRISELLTIAAKESYPDCEIVGIPVSDGGDGTVDAVIGALGGELRSIPVHNPYMETINASYGIYTISEEGAEPIKCAIIEMSAASGITLIPGDMLNPAKTTTYGTGELIYDALLLGCKQITIAIGGSAAIDGGIGAMRALGFRFLDSDGCELGGTMEDSASTGGTGLDLAKISSINSDNVCPLIHEADITVLCNVDNPLTGSDGSTFTFGRQKCSPDMDPDDINDILSSLEMGMNNYASVLEKTFGKNPNSVPGSGAAGGLGAALNVMLGAQLRLGAETILELIDFDSKLEGADICITGEGRLDWQSSRGKTVSGVAAHCKKLGIPLVAIVGSTGEGFEDAYDIGVSLIISTSGDAPVEKAMMNAEEYYLRAARAYFTQSCLSS